MFVHFIVRLFQARYFFCTKKSLFLNFVPGKEWQFLAVLQFHELMNINNFTNGDSSPPAAPGVHWLGFQPPNKFNPFQN